MSSQAPVLKLYNTLTREKEEFRPLDPSNVRMYVCGPTVYDHAHIGNARPLIVFDVLYRLLRHVYGADHVTYVRNITDVDDKINARAAERGISIRELTEETNKVFQDDVKALGCLEPTVQPRATEHIAQMIAIIEKLIASGHAYAADGNVLFDVPSMKDYGRLSRRPLDEMIAGARVDVAPYKRGDMDFVLWKPSKESEPGWDSPMGQGASRLAYRMFGDELEAPRRDFRHSRRRNRSRLPPPRKRNRPIALRLWPRRDGDCLDAQRVLAGRGRENVQEPGEFRDDTGVAGDGEVWRTLVVWLCASPCHAAHSLSAADRLDDESVRGSRRRDFSLGVPMRRTKNGRARCSCLLGR